MKILNALLILAISACCSFAQTIEEFGGEMANFYTSPSLARFEKLQTLSDKFYKELKNADGGAELLVSVMIWRASEKNSWPISGKGKASKSARELASQKGKLYEYVTNDSLVDPSKLDIWWSSFFATGDDIYLNKIMRYAGLTQDNKQINDLLIIGAATWSFKANCRQHVAVKNFAEKCLGDSKYADRQTFLESCLKESNKETNQAPAPTTTDATPSAGQEPPQP
jgi:hypothetical protein